MAFRNDFAWGAATAAYQIEGAVEADGKGPSVWDQFTAWPGKVQQGDTGLVACDHYHRLEEDLDLMAAIGLKAYRFSFSWPRVLPEGDGAANEPGLAFYDRLIDGLLARGIQPWATIFHWDYPLALYQRGGWLNADSPRWFADYTTLLARRYGDRVRHWITFNEPQMFVGLGHHLGVHAPGLRLPPADITRIAHHILLAHGRATQALREHCAAAPTIGWAPAVGVSAVWPGFEDDAEVVAAAHADQFAFPLDDPNIAQRQAIWSDPVFLGRYPEAFLYAYGEHLPPGWEADLPVINEPIEFCGQNIYLVWTYWGRDPHGQVRATETNDLGDGWPRTRFDWPVTPEALYWGPRHFWERYQRPIVITENGMSAHDWAAVDGAVRDPQRIDFTTRYLRELRRAARDGVAVNGYFHWSLMDNFEWAEGYRHRFGLIHVDFRNGNRRTLKASAHWYRDLIASNGALLD